MPLSDLFGRAVAGFDASHKAGRTAHAYLVVGSPDGAARDFALHAWKRLLSGGPGKSRDPENHPDISWLRPEKKSRQISVEQVRDAIRLMSKTSLCGGWRGCVFMWADRFTESAAAALLKTLEEPPPQAVIFLLTSRPQDVIATLKSRCQRVMLAPSAASLPDAEWTTRLEDALAGDDGTATGALMGASSVEALLQDILKETEKSVSDALPEDTDSDTAEAAVLAHYRGVRDSVVELMGLWCRDTLLTVCGVPSDQLFHQGRSEAIRRRASGMSCAAALGRIQAVEDMKRQFDLNMDEKTVLRLGFDRLAADK